jgi:hypothetical protein
VPWFKLYQHVYVTVRTKVGSQDGTKEGQPADVVSTAKVRDLVLGYINTILLHSAVPSPFSFAGRFDDVLILTT